MDNTRNEQNETIEVNEVPSKEEQVQEVAVEAELLQAQKAAGEAARKCKEYLELAQRVQADFENYKRRNASIRQEAHEEGVCETVIALLPVADNLERAVESAEQGGNGALREGVQMVMKQLLDSFSKLGVEEIPALGESFDPNLHDAVMQVEAEDPSQAGKVAGVMRKGYQRNGRVLRYAMVTVAQ